MNAISRLAPQAVVVLLVILVAGCGSNNAPVQTEAAKEHHAGSVGDDQRHAALAELNEEDRLLAEAQGYCAVMEEPLGSMGPPLKLVVNDQIVFICCKGCQRRAEANPDRTLAKVEELKARVTSEQQP